MELKADRGDGRPLQIGNAKVHSKPTVIAFVSLTSCWNGSGIIFGEQIQHCRCSNAGIESTFALTAELRYEWEK